jgi:hypothetical protein
VIAAPPIPDRRAFHSVAVELQGASVVGLRVKAQEGAFLIDTVILMQLEQARELRDLLTDAIAQGAGR